MPLITTVPLAAPAVSVKAEAKPLIAFVRSMVTGVLKGVDTVRPITSAMGGFTEMVAMPGLEVPPGPVPVNSKVSVPMKPALGV